MPGNKELLKSVIQDLINDRSEQAQSTMHNYFIAKSREVNGLGASEDTSSEIDQDIDPASNE